MAHSIRIINLTPDWDAQSDIILAGPYGDSEAADNARQRLNEINEIIYWEFCDSALDATAGGYDRVITPEELEAVTTAEQLDKLVYLY